MDYCLAIREDRYPRRVTGKDKGNDSKGINQNCVLLLVRDTLKMAKR